MPDARPFIYFLLNVGLVLAVGCSGEADNPTDRDPFLSGSATEVAKDSELQANVAFWTSTGRCSGALVGPRAILTAAHCLPDRKTGTLLYTKKHTFVGMKGEPVYDALFHRCPSYKPSVTDIFKTPDVGVIELTKPLPGPFAQIDYTHVEDGTRVITTGYAYDPKASERTYTLKYVRRRAQDFRSNFFGTARGSESASQGGDSGGPVYQHTNSLDFSAKPLTIVGVHSGSSEGGAYTNVAGRISTGAVSGWLRGILDSIDADMPDCLPSEEVCDGIDNDCDGVIDNVVATEVCDGVDNDCDGVIDEVGGESVCPECAPGVLAELSPYDPRALVCDADALGCDHCIYSPQEKKLFFCRRFPSGREGYFASDESPLACDAAQLGEVTYCSGRQLVCDAAGSWLDAPVSVEVCDGEDNDGDGLVDETFPKQGQSCDSGALGQCRIGAYRCKGSVYCATTIKPKNETCDGEDEDCNGTIDDGTFLGENVHAMEYLSEQMTQSLVGKSVKSLLFIGWAGHETSYAIYQVEPLPSKMLAVGQVRELFNQYAKNPVFASDQEVAALDAVVAVPPGFAAEYPNDTLLFFIKDTVKRLDLVTRSVTQTTLASFGIPKDASRQTLVVDRIDSATVVLPSDNPGYFTNYLIVMRGNELWLHCASCGPNGGKGWGPPFSAAATLCTASPTCPAALSGIQSFTRRPAAGQNSYLAAAHGSSLHYTAIENDVKGAIAFNWQAPMSLLTISCAR